MAGVQRQREEMEEQLQAAQKREEFAKVALVAQENVVTDLQQVIAEEQNEQAA